MIDYSEFFRKFKWDSTDPIHQNYELRTRIYIGRETNESAQEVIIKQVNAAFSFGGNLMGQGEGLLTTLRRSLDEWSALLISQGTHTVKVKGMALRFTQEKKGSTNFDLESYICFEKMEFDLDKYYLQERNKLKPADYHRLVQSCLEILQYFEDNSIYHNDIKPSNMVMARRKNATSHNEESDFDFKMIDFGTGKVDSAGLTRQFTAGIPSSKGYTPLILRSKIDQDEVITSNFRREIDHYMMGMTLFAVGCQVSDLAAVVKVGKWMYSKNEEREREGKTILEAGLETIEGLMKPNGSLFKTIIENLLGGRSRISQLLMLIPQDKNRADSQQVNFILPTWIPQGKC